MNKMVQFYLFGSVFLQCYFSLAMEGVPEAQKVKSIINVLTENFPDEEIFLNPDLETYRQRDWVTAKNLEINYVSDNFMSFDFQNYGFQAVADVVSRELLSKEGMHNDEGLNKATENVAKNLEAKLLEWGKENGIDADAFVMAAGCVKRNLSKDSSLAKSYSFAHIDFPEGFTKETIKSFGGEELWQKFAPYEILQVVNIWLPLNNEPNINTLAVMDKRKAKFKRTIRTKEYFGTEAKQFNSVYLEEKQPLEDNWFLFKISKGDAIIFDSERTPHCAVHVLNKNLSNEPRKSIEYRGFFLKVVKK